MTTTAAPALQAPTNPLRRLLFVETITAPGQPDARGRLGETQARTLLRRAAARGYTVEATRSGGALITWTVGRLGPADTVITSPRTLTLEPVTPARITPTVRGDLEAVSDYPRTAALFLAPDARTDGHGRISSGLYSIPPATSERLIASGLLTTGEITAARDSFGRVRGAYTSVCLSLVARLALHAADHATSTGAPQGWVTAAHSAGRQDRGGRLYSRSSWANCACRWSSFAEDRPDAARLAREHRQSQTADLITAL